MKRWRKPIYYGGFELSDEDVVSEAERVADQILAFENFAPDRWQLELLANAVTILSPIERAEASGR